MRSDGAYCSSACRQAAYRARRRLHPVLAAELAELGQAYVDLITSVTDAQFEAVIASAIADGDLSRENLTRLLERYAYSRNEVAP